MKVEIEIKDKLYTQDVDNFVGIVTDMINLYAKKNHDYGNSFDEGCRKFGIAYAIGRMYDKMNRIVNLTRNPNTSLEVKEESVRDTIQDLANYAVMYLAYIDKEKKRISEENDSKIRFGNLLGQMTDDRHQGCEYDASQSDPD